MKIIPKVFLLLLLVTSPLLLKLVLQTDFLQNLILFVESNLLLYLLALFIAKSLAIIYPPLPGGILTLASIPLIGWKLAYVIDITGSLTGAAISFYLGKKYGLKIVSWFIGEKITNKITSIKLKDKNQFEAAIFIRIAAGGILSDGLAWGASLIGFRALPFIVGYFISHLVTTLPIFYLIGASISFQSWIIVGLAAITAIVLLYKFKGRYFE